MSSSTVRLLTIDDLPDGGLEIPYVDVRGASDGPNLTVLAGVHGTEYTSIAAVREFARGLDPEQVSGRITAVPVVNLPASGPVRRLSCRSGSAATGSAGAETGSATCTSTSNNTCESSSSGTPDSPPSARSSRGTRLACY